MKAIDCAAVGCPEGRVATGGFPSFSRWRTTENGDTLILKRNLPGGVIVSNHLTRGKVISLIAGLPLTVAAMTAVASADDDSGGTKAQLKYQDKPGPKGAKCSGCTLFKAPAACSVVKGKISPNGYCIAYAPKAK